LHVGGDTKAEALKNMRDAIVAYIISYLKHGDPIPMAQIISQNDKACRGNYQIKEEEVRLPFNLLPQNRTGIQVAHP